MILPRGVTGFIKAGDAPLPSVEFRRFRALCFDAVRRLDAHVLKSDARYDQVTPNFHSIIVDMERSQIAIICNEHFPLVGIATPLTQGSCELKFVQHLLLSEALKQDVLFQIVAADVLNSGVENSHLSELSPAEMDQVRYWNPSRIGDVIFNFWD